MYFYSALLKKSKVTSFHPESNLKTFQLVKGESYENSCTLFR